MEREKTALIIDNSAGLRRFEKLLSDGGYKVHTASSRTVADTYMNTVSPNLVLANVFHSDFPAVDYIRDIRSMPGNQELKTILYGESPLISLVSGDKCQIQGYFKKPVDFSALTQLLGKLARKPAHKSRVPILLADADFKSIDVIRMYLQALYYEPFFAATIDEARAVIEKQNPSAVLTGILLQSSSGLELIKELRDNPSRKDIPIVVISDILVNQLQKNGNLTGGAEFIAEHIQDKQILDAADEYFRETCPVSFADIDKPTVLIADDQPLLIEVMSEMLINAGFKVYTASDGQETVEKIQTLLPDIAVLDYDMPVKDGFAVAQELKNNPLFAHLPIIILTAISDKQTKLKGLSLGIDDYITKPIDTEELIAKIRMILKRNKQVLDSNPLTKLPGNTSIQSFIEKEIKKQKKFAVLYIDLDQFKAYNDVYGFENGDNVIKSTANVLVNALRQYDREGGFIGHIGGDDFIIVTSYERCELIAGEIVKEFDLVVPSFYSQQDRKRGYIISEDRTGNVRKFPFLSISVGIVHNYLRPLVSVGQISHLGSDLKRHAKSLPGSNYIVDRRTD